MKSKKSSAPKSSAPELVDDDGYLCLKGDRLWKWRALDAELRAASVELDSVRARVQAEVAKNPELGALLSRQAELAGAASTARAEAAQLRAEIEKAFGVSLAECAFDDKTGRLYHLTAEGRQGPPVSPRQPTRRRKK